MIVNMLRTIWREEVFSYRYGRELAFALLFGALFFGGYQGFQWYKANRERSAQYAMAEAIDEIDKANYYLLDSKERNVQLAQQYYKDAQLAFDVMDNTHANSDLIPYSYAFKADIALRQGDHAQALDLLNKAIAQMSYKDKLYGMMLVKRSLVRIDSQDEQTGVAELEKYAQDSKNKAADTAAFYLGYYYFTHDKQSDAIRVWTALRDSMKNVDKKSAQSPWLVIVEDKLQQLGA